MRHIRVDTLKIVIFGMLWFPMIASATLFEFICDSPLNCDGDTNFSFTIELADSVVAPNASYSTGSDGGLAFLGWTATSSIGDGFSISGGYANITGKDPWIGISFDGAGHIDGMWDTDSLIEPFTGGGSILTFNQTGVGLLDWDEGGFVTLRFDLAPPPFGASSTNIYGHFESVPEPTTLALMGIGLAGIGWKRRKAA